MAYAFGIDTEQYSSSDINDRVQKMMNWQTAALYQPLIRFVFVRSGISWGYKDTRFNFNWDGVRSMDFYRAQAGISALPVGRGAYHVLYPGQDETAQYDNFMRIVDPVADWAHDRAVIDLELHQSQSRRTITDRTKRFAYKIRAATGRYPILYARSIWLNTYTYPAEMNFMDLWLAQYLNTQTPYTPEYPPPPSTLPGGFRTWLIHQTGDHCPPIGSPVKTYMDYNRWNGDEVAVAKYFGYEIKPPPEPEPEPEPEPVYDLDWLIRIHTTHTNEHP